MKLILFTIAMFTTLQALPQQLVPAANRSKVQFAIKNFGITVNGSFGGLQGRIVFNPASPEKAVFAVSIDAATVNTGNQARDKHLRKPDYFDVAHHAKIQFHATSVRAATAPGQYWMEGLVSIKGTQKTVKFLFTAAAQEGGYRFAGSFNLNRRDFNVGGGSLVLADELKVTLDVIALP